MANTATKVIEIALNEVGYLEKKSNSQLDNKTANAGSNNYTKYARDLDNVSGFYNGKKNGYAWCDVWVDWCFVKAFGVDKAKELLCQPSKSYGAGCYYSAKYYKDKGQFYTKNPKVGDQIFFWNSSKSDVAHTGLVYKVDSTYVYTVEGNTSSASGVVANGGAVEKKKYSLTYSRIYGYGRPRYDNEEKTVVATPKNYLEKGDSGKSVKVMQENLIKLGYSCGSSGADGEFGSNTESALKKFQKANGLVVDGEYGEKSKAKVESLLANLIGTASTGSSADEKKIWNYFKDKIGNDYGVAGLMGNLYAESALCSNNLQNSYQNKLGYTDSTYTAAVDSGAYDNFVKDSAGYGLAQWTFYTRKQNLLNYAKAQNKSVGDIEMQLNFLYKELSESYKSVISDLKAATSVLEASNSVLIKFEKPASQGKSVQKKRAEYGQKYYDKYASKQSIVNKIDTVKEVQSWANKNYNAGLVADGKYGEKTKKALIVILQKELNQTYKTNLKVDGIWGNKTKSACPVLKIGSKNDVVNVLQALLICNGIKNVYVDGDYGSLTFNAVKAYQRKSKIVEDGEAGKNTFAKLCD